ncbi:MAG TPA: hypothetical protein VN258_11495 [Mobilitalea sp.]|nr:hypothetical protein [Mobilitalea sp.]
MEFTGKILGTGAHEKDMTIIFTVNEKSDIYEEYTKLKDCEKLRIKVDKYREKRSLDANAYFHLLNGKIAEALHISQDRCKNILLSRYGQLEYIDGKIPTYLIKSQYDNEIMERSDIHFKPIGHEVLNDEDYTKYAVIRGSHTYDTKEMSVLIDRTVEDAKELGINTVSPDEIRMMMERWGV